MTDMAPSANAVLTESHGPNEQPSQFQQMPQAAPYVIESQQEVLEADPQETDSAYGESTKSSFLTSIASEVTRGLYENGRRYHSYGSGEYGFPNDERESDRLDMQHAMMTQLMSNRLFWAPIQPDPLKVLDIGTGTGIWAIDFAEIFPTAEVIGTDLSPIQPSWVPPNCKFEIDDAEREWTYQKDSFDFIHSRNLVVSIRDWSRLLDQTYEHLKPGAWAEFQIKYPDIISDDGSLAEDSALRQWTKLFFAAADKFGTTCEETRMLKQRMEDAGFVDVEEHVCKLPIGPWPKNKQLKKCGAFELVNMVDGIEGLSFRLFSRILGMSIEEVQVLLVDVRKEAKNSKIHSYYSFYVVYGRKPEA